MNNRRYRGKKGLSGGQVMIIAASVILAMVALTIWACADMTGTSAGTQLHDALFVLKDW